MKILLPATLTKVETRTDRSIKLVFDTRELGEDTATLFKLAHSEGWLVYASTDDITDEDIPDERADSMTGSKTQAQRLRASLFVLWKQRGAKGDFENYYRSMTEKFIETVKEKLN